MTIFKCKNECNLQLAQKVDEKMGSLVYWGHFHVSYLMVVKVPKVVHFFQFCTAVSKKFKSVLAVCIYVFESSPCVFAENWIFIMTYCYWDISIWSWRISLNFCWVTTFFDTLILNIMWIVSPGLENEVFWCMKVHAPETVKASSGKHLTPCKFVLLVVLWSKHADFIRCLVQQLMWVMQR